MTASTQVEAMLRPLSGQALQLLKRIPHDSQGIDRNTLRSQAGIASIAKMTALMKELELHGRAKMKTDYGRCRIYRTGPPPAPPTPFELGRSLAIGGYLDDMEAEKAQAIERRDALTDEAERARLDHDIRVLEGRIRAVGKWLERKVSTP